jgi:hypothetical protein
LLSNHSLQCGAPRRAPQTVDFAISFDGSVWSSEPVAFVYTARIDLFQVLPGIFLGAVVVAIAVAAAWRLCGWKEERAPGGEYAPFVPKRARGTKHRKRRHEA